MFIFNCIYKTLTGNSCFFSGRFLPEFPGSSEIPGLLRSSPGGLAPRGLTLCWEEAQKSEGRGQRLAHEGRAGHVFHYDHIFTWKHSNNAGTEAG